MRVVIFGLGKASEDVFADIELYQEDMEMDVVAISDSDAALCKVKKYSFPFVKKEALKEISYDYLIITSNKYYDEIFRDFQYATACSCSV